MRANLQNWAEEGRRDTAEYAQAVHLLNKKKELQANLREVDRRLRELETLTAGVISLARDDINRKR